MPRKNNDKNPLQIRVRARSIPKSVKPAKYLETLLDVIDGRRQQLPPAWDVSLSWRNPGTKHGVTKRWRDDDFASAVQESRDGFNFIVRSEIQRALRRVHLEPKQQQRKPKRRQQQRKPKRRK